MISENLHNQYFLTTYKLYVIHVFSIPKIVSLKSMVNHYVDRIIHMSPWTMNVKLKRKIRLESNWVVNKSYPRSCHCHSHQSRSDAKDAQQAGNLQYDSLKKVKIAVVLPLLLWISRTILFHHYSGYPEQNFHAESKPRRNEGVRGRGRQQYLL